MVEIISNIFYYVGLVQLQLLSVVCMLYFPRKENISKSGKWILVTGGASGIGLATVKQLIQEGCSVVVCDMNEEHLKELSKHYESSKNLKTFRVDISRTDEIQKLYNQLIEDGIQIYAIANIAGIWNAPGYGPKEIKLSIEMNPDQEVLPVVDVNLLGAMRVNHIFFPMIKASKGCILQVTSTAGRLQVIVSNAAYGISKSALISYMNYLRREVQHLGIRVVCIEPGPVRTELAFGAMNNMETFEYTKTNFEKMYKDTVKPFHFFGVDNPRLWRTPSQVSDTIVKSLFTSKISNPHIIVDSYIMKFGIIMLSCLPYKIQDVFLNGRRWSS